MDRITEPANCRETCLLLAAYKANELPPETARAVERHVAGCAGCRAELEDTARALAAITELRNPAQPADLSLQRLRRQACDAAAKTPVPIRLRKFQFAAAAALVFAIVVSYMLFVPQTHKQPRRHVAPNAQVTAKHIPPAPVVAVRERELKTPERKAETESVGKNPRRSVVARSVVQARSPHQSDDPLNKEIRKISDELDNKFAASETKVVYSTGWRTIDADISSIGEALSDVESEMDEI